MALLGVLGQALEICEEWKEPNLYKEGTCLIFVFSKKFYLTAFFLPTLRLLLISFFIHFIVLNIFISTSFQTVYAK